MNPVISQNINLRMFDINFLKQRRHWIFDLDGTLTISAHDFEHIRRELGLAPQTPILEALQAMPATEAAPLWKSLDELECYYAGQASIMGGAHNLLQKLQGQGCQLAILTRNTLPVVKQTLRACAIDHFFSLEYIVDRDVCAPKPSPDGIKRLLNLWQASATDTVMVGDYVFDLIAGRSAGVATIHLDTCDAPDWSEFTDLRVAALDEIFDYL